MKHPIPHILQVANPPLQRKGAQWDFTDPAIWANLHRFLAGLEVADSPAAIWFINASLQRLASIFMQLDGLLVMEAQNEVRIRSIDFLGKVLLENLLTLEQAAGRIDCFGNLLFSGLNAAQFRSVEQFLNSQDANTLLLAHTGPGGVLQLYGESKLQLTGGAGGLNESLRNLQLTGTNALQLGSPQVRLLDFLGTQALWAIAPSTTWSIANDAVVSCSGNWTGGTSGGRTDLRVAAGNKFRLTFPTASYIEGEIDNWSPGAGRKVDLGKIDQPWDDVHTNQHGMSILFNQGQISGVTGASGEVNILQSSNWTAWPPAYLIPVSGDDFAYDDVAGDVTITADDWQMGFTISITATSNNTYASFRARAGGVEFYRRESAGRLQNGESAVVSDVFPFAANGNTLTLTIEATGGSFDVNQTPQTGTYWILKRH